MRESREIWEEIFSSREWGRYPSIYLVRFVARNFYSQREKKQLKVLELGSGGGANLGFLAREGFEVSGIDFSNSACEQAIKRLKAENLEHRIGDIYCGDFSKDLDKYPDEYFDLVIDIEGLTNIAVNDAELVINKIARKLIPNGKFFSQTFSGEMWINSPNVENVHNSVIPQMGTTSNLGVLRFTSEDDIRSIYQNELLGVTDVQKLTLTALNGKVIESEWLITCVRK